MTVIPFVQPLSDPRYGEAVELSPLIRRIVAENPSKYSYMGTGTYIVGRGDVAVIDPGPLLDSHRNALTCALENERVRAILVTHCHSDHSPLAAWLKDESGAPTVAFGPHGSGGHTHPVLPDDPNDAPEADPSEPGTAGEPIDSAFNPDIAVSDAGRIELVPGITFTAVYTPGHTSNHMCYALENEAALFTGDHIMGWSTTVVSPPDGDMAAYIDSLRKVTGRGDRTLYPTHGNPITAPDTFVGACLQHRLDREDAIVNLVESGVDVISDIVEILYADVRAELHRPARRSVLSHVAKLVGEGRVLVHGGGLPGANSRYLPA